MKFILILIAALCAWPTLAANKLQFQYNPSTTEFKAGAYMDVVPNHQLLIEGSTLGSLNIRTESWFVLSPSVLAQTRVGYLDSDVENREASEIIYLTQQFYFPTEIGLVPFGDVSYGYQISDSEFAETYIGDLYEFRMGVIYKISQTFAFTYRYAMTHTDGELESQASKNEFYLSYKPTDYVELGAVYENGRTSSVLGRGDTLANNTVNLVFAISL